MTCPICGRWAPADPDTGYDADTLCPTCQADGYRENDRDETWWEDPEVCLPEHVIFEHGDDDDDAKTGSMMDQPTKALQKEAVIVAIDPGPDHSAYVEWDQALSPPQRLGRHGWMLNEALLAFLSGEHAVWDPRTTLVIEKIESFGMPVGMSVFETVFWSGRFAQAWKGPVDRLARRVIKIHFCQSPRATDVMLRRVILDQFGGDMAIGTKAAPGPLYGLRGHELSALAVALAYADGVRPSLFATVNRAQV